MRGDVGFLRDVLPHLVGEEAPGQPRLIHFAVYGGPAVLELLAEHGRRELEIRDRDGRTPLMLAAALPQAGPTGAKPRELEVPLSEIVAAQSCQWLLSAGAKIEARDPQGWTALHWAAYAGRPMSVEALIQSGATIDALDHRGRTPLMLALVEHLLAVNAKSIEILLRAGADADLRDDHGWTTLHYLAAGGGSVHQRSVAQQLLARGARPSRDRAGRSPADLCAYQGALQRAWSEPGREHDGGPLDSHTAVAAGPGPYRLLTEPALAERLLDQLVPEQPDPSRPQRTTHRPRVSLDDWQVWADWLQSRGDPRGELTSTSLACVGRGGRKRRRMHEMLAHVGLRTYSTSHAGLHCADALSPARQTPLQLKWTHGFLTAVTIQAFHGLDSARVPEIATALLASEPLLAELRIHVNNDQVWPDLISALAGMQASPRLRRLVLEGLPVTLPRLDDLAHTLPSLRSLWLIGNGKIHSGRVHWPGPKHLRLRHSMTSEYGPVRHGIPSERRRGNVDLMLDMPDLTHLDLALPVGRTEQEEIDGARGTLDARAGVEHLRLCPLGPEFAAGLLGSPTIASLRTLELVSVRGAALEVLVGRVELLRKLARVRVSMVPAVAEQRAALLERLRRELPNLELDTGPGRRPPFTAWGQ